MDAWGDESVRVVCTPPVYLLAATYRTDGGDIDATPLERLKPKGANKLHWREMGDKTKMESARAVAELEASHTIVAACNIATNKQERARRKCLEIMLARLEALGVTRYVLESRGKAEDKRDMKLLMSLRSKGVCKEIGLEHVEASGDSRLWVPDQVLGLYGDMRSGVANLSLKDSWNRLSPFVNSVEIWP